MSGKNKSKRNCNKSGQSLSKRTQDELMDVTTPADKRVKVQCIRLPSCASEIESTLFQSNMVDNGTRLLRELSEASNIQTGDFMLTTERFSCKFKSDSDRYKSDCMNLKELLELRDKKIQEHTTNIAELRKQLEPFIAFGKVSEYLRYFGDAVVFPFIQKHYKQASAIPLSTMNNWNEMLKYLGPFKNRSNEQINLQNYIYGVVQDYKISGDQWSTLYDMNRVRNYLLHGIVDPKEVEEMVSDVQKLEDKEYTIAVKALATAIKSLQSPQTRYSTLRQSQLHTPRGPMPKFSPSMRS